MFTSNWKRLSGVSVFSLAAALALAACDSSERVSDARETAEDTTVAEDIPEYTADDENLTAGEVGPDAESPAREDHFAQGLEDLTNLDGRSINTADGKQLGQVTQVVVDDAQNVFAVIELDDAEATPQSSGTVVVDVDDIDREQNTLILMSQEANLEPYRPENFKPLGVRTEP